MGCSLSSGELTKFKVNESIAGQGQQTINIANSLGVTKKDLNRLFKAFVSFDEVRLKTGRKQQGKQNVEEFFEHITTKEIAHHLAISFYSKSGEINFEEFVITCWWIVSLNEEEVAKWIFRLFDGDHDDKMTPTEMKHLVQTIGSHNQNSMKGLEGCYQHLCFEKVEQQHKPKGPLFYGKPMQSHDPVDNPKFVTREKLFVTLVEWTSDISKKPSVLKPIFEMQAMLREKTVRSRFFKWREFRQKTFGSSLTLDEIIELLGTEISYKSQLKPHARASGKVTSIGSVHVVASGKGSDKIVGHGHPSERTVVAVEEPAVPAVKPHHFHVDRRPSTSVPATDTDTHPSSTRHSQNQSRKASMDKGHHPTTASAAQSNRESHSHTPQITPRSTKEKSHHPTTASAAQSNRESHSHTPQITPRSTKEKDHPRSTFPALDKENLYRDVLEILEQNSNVQAPSKGTFNTVPHILSSSHRMNHHIYLAY